MFYIMEYVQGRIFWEPALPDVDPSDRTAIYDQMNRVLVALHSVNVETIGLTGFGRITNASWVAGSNNTGLPRRKRSKQWNS